MRETGAVGFGESLERRLCAGEKTRAVCQARMRSRHLRPLASAGGQLLEVRHLLLQIEALGLALLELACRLGRELLEPTPGAVRFRRLAGELRGVAVGIQQIALRGRPQKRLVRMLPMDVEQELAGLPQLRERCGVAVDEAAGAARLVDRPAKEYSTRIAGKFAFPDPRVQRGPVRKIEVGGKVRPLGAFADQRAVALAADEELDR